MAWGTFQLSPLMVYAVTSAYIVDSKQMLDGALTQWHFIPAPQPIYYYEDRNNCAAESEFYLAFYEELDKISELTDIIGHTSNALESFSCEQVAGKSICVDLFIMNARSFVFGGDDRWFNEDAGISNSRVHIYIDPTTLQQEVKINSTRINLFGVYLTRQDSARLFKPGDIQITSTGTGFEVHAKFFNNFCPVRAGCPAINLTLYFTRDEQAPGGYHVSWSRDGFPSMGVYTQNSGNWAAMRDWAGNAAEDPERIRSSWLNWVALRDGFRQSVNLPPGCNLQ